MGQRRVAVRRSPVHGRGVFALRDITAGERILRLTGEVIDWDVACERYAGSAAEDGHTFFFDLGDGRVIDCAQGGSARWINHGCDPSCEAVQDGERVTVYARTDILTGAELLLDYQLQVDATASDDERAVFACSCGAPSCRGTMLA